jgi:biopolymer transport protein ExbB/TolQ
MGIFVLLSLANPMTWLITVMIVVTWSRIFRRANKKEEDASRIVRIGAGSPEAIGAAFQFLSIAYRPNHAFTAKAQIVQHEDADDDEEGGPDTPQKHLHRQLRRIRRGEAVERLVWRLE